MVQYNGLHFDPILVRSNIYVRCKTTTCDVFTGTNPIRSDHLCKTCALKDRFAAFAMAVDFEFQLVNAPPLFCEIRGPGKNHIVSTMEIIELYISALDYLDKWCNPEMNVMDDEEWHKAAYEDRKKASELWGSPQRFVELLNLVKDNALKMIQALERRIIQGQMIFAQLSGTPIQSEPDFYITTNLIPVEQERAPVDRLQERLALVRLANEDKHKFKEQFYLDALGKKRQNESQNDGDTKRGTNE